MVVTVVARPDKNKNIFSIFLTSIFFLLSNWKQVSSLKWCQIWLLSKFVFNKVNIGILVLNKGMSGFTSNTYWLFQVSFINLLCHSLQWCYCLLGDNPGVGVGGWVGDGRWWPNKCFNTWAFKSPKRGLQVKQETIRAYL